MPTTLQHTDRALAVARETGWDIDGEATDREWSGVGVGPVGQHRDSDALERSNYATVLADLQSTCADAIGEASFGHWGVGWVEEIIFDAGNPEAVAAVESWRDALEDYPVADGEAFSALEYGEALETIEAILPSWIVRDDVELERVDDLPEDFASQIFSAMFEAGDDTTPDGMRGNAIEDAAHELGFYVVAAS